MPQAKISKMNIDYHRASSTKIEAKFPTRDTLIFGPYGSGKTHLIGTAQEDSRLSPVLCLDFEGSGSTLEGSGVKTERIYNWQDFNECYDFLVNDKHEYKTVAIDSITEVHTFSMFDLADTNDQHVEKNKFQQDEYGIAMNQVIRLIKAFRDLPMNTIFIALSETRLLPKEGNVILPSMYGKLADHIGAKFDGVFYNVIDVNKKDPDKYEHVLILQNYPGIRAKIRTIWGKTAPNEIIEPTFTKIYDAYGVKND